MKRVAVIGGGIAGLSAAWYLEKARHSGAALEWTLFEKSARLGGVIQTERRDGYVLEAGPDSFLTIKPDASQLCREIGIADQLITSNDFQRKTYILVKGKLVPVPDGLEFMVPTRVAPMATTSLFSFATKLRMAREKFLHTEAAREDESVASFVRRHFGQEMVDRVADPLLSGVYGGSAEHLSVRAVLPRFVEMEREHGSLVRATLQARKARTQSNSASQPLFTSLKNGMQQMVETLVAQLPADSLRLQRSVSLARRGDSWQVRSAGIDETYDAVLLAVPAPAASCLLKPVQSDLSSMLGKIPYTSSAAVLLAYKQADLPPGFGFLVPRPENRKILACTFVHKKFSYRVPEGSALLRCFFSSSRMSDLMERTDEDLEDIAQKELAGILGLNAKLEFVRTFRWGVAMAQYEVGHLERVVQMENMLARLPGLHVIGNSFHGIGIPDCIKSGRIAVEKILASG
jgi:protoporphyrinogen/coproporphyrinogen III oxidase